MREVKDCWTVCYKSKEGKNIIVKVYNDELVAEEEAYIWSVETDVVHYVKKARATKKEGV